jgi:DNA-binding HxlR family transcriptional regulator
MMTSVPHERPVEPDHPLIAKALSIIGGKWRLYIILILGEQTLRFSQLAEQLPGVSEKVLAGELKALVSLGVMLRTGYAEMPPRVEYTLTQKARSALPLLRQIQQIGQLIS